MGNTASTPSNASLPDRHPPVASSSLASPPAGCPMHQEDKSNQAAPSAVTPADNREPSFLESLNPLNNIPLLPQSPISSTQQTTLSLERTVSSIPRASSNSSDGNSAAPAGACPVAHDSKGKQKAADQDEETNWVYPSPQQFYNALMRKGKDTPEQSIDVMVHIHNFLNERAWDEVRRWEDMRNPGERIQLARFEGRPQDLSPKARFHLLLGSIFSNTHNSTPPFDRHDWYVSRPSDGTSQRYVIDYYSAPDDENGDPVFHLDVRPAVDSPGAVYSRMTEWARLKKQAWIGEQS